MLGGAAKPNESIPRSGAGVGVGMLRGPGDSLTRKQKSYQNCNFMFFDGSAIHVKDFKAFLRGSSSFPGACLRLCNFSKFKKFQNFEISKHKKNINPKTKFPNSHIAKLKHFKNSTIRNSPNQKAKYTDLPKKIRISDSQI